MARPSRRSASSDRTASVTTARLRELLDELALQYDTQQEIAANAGLTPQLLADLKQGRRPLTELVARRLADEYGVSFEWLLGRSEVKQSGLARSSGGMRLPLFQDPIAGDPLNSPRWDGVGVEVSGHVVAAIARAKWPYVLKFGSADTQGRLRRGDLVLVSQSVCPEAEIQVVKSRIKLYLARRQEAGHFVRVANEELLPAESPVVGYCVAIIWSALADTAPPSNPLGR